MQIQLKTEESFTVKANGREVVGMKVVSRWEGLIKLSDTKGRSLIIAHPARPFDNLFRSLLGNPLQETTVIMGSPDLIAELTPVKPNNSEAAIQKEVPDPAPSRHR